jgi:hypothetical protein
LFPQQEIPPTVVAGAGIEPAINTDEVFGTHRPVIRAAGRYRNVDLLRSGRSQPVVHPRLRGPRLRFAAIASISGL